jgi:hypothetical protein
VEITQNVAVVLAGKAYSRKPAKIPRGVVLLGKSTISIVHISIISKTLRSVPLVSHHGIGFALEQFAAFRQAINLAGTG